MPLSEREQQILEQLEQDLRGGSESRARAPQSRDRLAGLKLGIVVFVAGIVLLAWFFASGLLIAGVLAFAAMVGGVVLGAASVRANLQEEGPGRRIARAISSWENTLRSRYRRDR